ASARPCSTAPCSSTSCAASSASAFPRAPRRRRRSPASHASTDAQNAAFCPQLGYCRAPGMDENEVPKTSFKSRGPYAVLAALIVLALAAGGVAWYWHKMAPEPLAQAPDAREPAAADAGSTEPGADLAEGEQVAKSSLADLVPKAWLEGGDTVRRIAAAVNAVSEGQSPRVVMLVMQPEGGFIVDEKKEVVKKGRKRVTHSTFFI